MINRRIPLLALLSLAAAASVVHGAPPAPAANRNFYQAVETQAGSVTLPSSPQGSLVVIPCPGCAPKTYLATATSRYLLGEKAVTLPELKAAIIGRPSAFVTVIYHEKTNELYSISASVDTPVGPPPAKAGRNKQPAR